MPTFTHVVENQPEPPPDFDALSDPALEAALSTYGASLTPLRELGTIAGSTHAEVLCRDANRNKPELCTFDRYGHRVDEVHFHPAYHTLLELGKTHGVHSYSWDNEGTPGAFVTRAALHFLYYMIEPSVACPMTMTHAAIPSLRRSPEVAAIWEPLALSKRYDPRLIEPTKKAGVMLGMAMTEKQGGSDVRSNTTVATPCSDGVTLLGHKFFCSAPMSDGFLTLAQGPRGLSCYLVPRIRSDGSRNPFFIQRLKDKLGNHANASSELEYRDTWAIPIGEPGRGVRTIIDMVAQTRVDVALGAAAGMRQAVRYAVKHCAQREAFGKRLIQQPLMQNVLADLIVETEASIALAFRTAAAFDRGEALLQRILTPIAKYWLSKRVIDVTAEALECHGGSGYVEDFPLARLYREAPLGSVWEGSGNVQCLDVLRVLQRTPDAAEALLTELSGSVGSHPTYDRWVDEIKAELSDPSTREFRARRLVGRLAVATQGHLLLTTGPAVVAEAFLSRRAGPFGQLSKKSGIAELLSRGR